MYIYDWFIHTFEHSLRTQAQIAYNGAFPLPSFLPLLVPFVPLASLFNPLLLTWNPPSCDRIRPPRSQVACKLTPLDTPPPQPSPSKFPEPELPSTSLGRPQDESGVFCPEQVQIRKYSIFMFIYLKNCPWQGSQPKQFNFPNSIFTGRTESTVQYMNSPRSGNEVQIKIFRQIRTKIEHRERIPSPNS
jgi:hypothetical protein